MKALIIYDCDPDGLGAAVTLADHLSVDKNMSVEFFRAIRYGEPPIEKIDKQTEVYIVDFNYDAHFTELLCNIANKVIVIDHHKTTLEQIGELHQSNLELLINIEKSAATLAYEYTKRPKDLIPPMLLYIEDMDLWKFRLPCSRDIAFALGCEKTDIETYKNLIKKDPVSFVDAGLAIGKYISKTVDILAKQAVLMEIGGYRVRTVNCSDPAIISFLGHRLAKNRPFGAVWFLRPDGKFKVSLRSVTGEKNPKGVNVDFIAKKYGGGGHPNASSFRVDKLFPFKLVHNMKVTR